MRTSRPVGPGTRVCRAPGIFDGLESRDLRADRTAFLLAGRTGRSAHSLQYHLHQYDAVNALLKAANPRNVGRILYATDGEPVRSGN